jgi:UDP-glucose 4-epimerase
MRILVTGGTGLLGGRLIPNLVESGHQIFAVTRSPSSHTDLEGNIATSVDADLDNGAPLTLPVIDAIVHAAALFRFSGPREPFFRTNVDGTAALLKAAKTVGTRTFIFISAAGIIMDDAGSSIHNADESAPTFPNHFSAYLASKARRGSNRSTTSSRWTRPTPSNAPGNRQGVMTATLSGTVGASKLVPLLPSHSLAQFLKYLLGAHVFCG